MILFIGLRNIPQQLLHNPKRVEFASPTYSQSIRLQHREWKTDGCRDYEFVSRIDARGNFFLNICWYTS